MPELKKYCRTGCGLVAAIGLAGCGRENASVGASEAEPQEFEIPAVPARAPIETARLGSNVFESICHIGNPFAIVGWDADSQTRFLYFVGPFYGAGDGLTHPYMYLAIPAPDRASVNTTLYMDRLDEPEFRKHAKPGELRRFLLPHIVGLPTDPEEIRQQLGEPRHTRKLKSGLTRLIFERDVCLNGKRLVGVYADLRDDQLVSAKGVDHPDRLRWIISAGRPPQPDPTPTYYQDWKPREGSAQAAALAFMFEIESRNAESARAMLWQPDSPPHPLEDFAPVFTDGQTIDTNTLTYQTMRYELDLAEVVVAFRLSSGRGFRSTIELREASDRRWLIGDWRQEGDP
jgi:hypothetical protein